jgi:acetyl esterase
MPLDPGTKLLLDLIASSGHPPTHESTPADARLGYRALLVDGNGEQVPVGAVEDLTVAGRPARVYRPEGAGPWPTLVFLHGGGFVIGDLDTHDQTCRRICSGADTVVLSVDYRLAPEAAYPAAVEDALAAVRWAAEHRAELSGGELLAVGGDSAGGNLAAVVSQKAMTAGGPAPCAQVLLYPALDRTVERRSLELFREGFLIGRADIAWYHLQYTGSAVAQPDPAQNPLLAKDLAGVAPALIVTAGFDPLRDEGEAYADALRQADVPVVLKRFQGMLHGFCSMATISPACDAAVGDIVAELRALVGPASAVSPG